MQGGDIHHAKILDMWIMQNGKKKSKVHWIGYPTDRDQWVWEGNVSDMLVAEYEKRQREQRQGAMSVYMEIQTLWPW